MNLFYFFKKFLHSREYTKEKSFVVLRDTDIFSHENLIPKDNNSWVSRPTGKVILINANNEIALIGNRVHDFFMLPGGGINEDETIEEGLIRECLEETGYIVSLTSYVGHTESFRNRNSRYSTTYCYTAQPISFQGQSLTDSEKEIGVYVKWIPLDEVLALFTQQKKLILENNIPFYNTCFNSIRDLHFVRKILKN